MDGSVIRERMHPDVHGNRAPSLAEAIVKPGHGPHRHCHQLAAEIYRFLCGCGEPQPDDAVRGVPAGDTVPIPPGRWHSAADHGKDDLVFRGCGSPAATAENTVRQAANEGGGR